MKQPFLRTEHNYDMHAESKKSGLHCKDKSLTDQSFKESVDINTLVERFGITGQMPQVLNLPKYGDFTGVFDFQTAMNSVRTAEEGFMELPAKIRARFHNNPQELLQFIENEENRPEAIKLGLITDKPKEPEKAPEPQPAPTPKPTT